MVTSGDHPFSYNHGMHPGDTIVAISSAVGPCARIIVRISGPQARPIASPVVPDLQLGQARAARTTLHFNHLAVPCSLYCFVAPRSYTGDDVIEFHVPGNSLLARMLLDELVRRGARHADPGEFTARAYFNGRMDLSEAEGVAATIAAQSERELHAARQLMSGELSRRLRPVLDSIAESLALVEVGIDFSEEDVSFLTPAELRDRVARCHDALEKLLADSTRFESLAHEPRIVLVGHPNAGKSTLLNALAGDARAVVSPQPGTTRDAIWSHVRLARGLVKIIDVAGLTSSPGTPGEGGGEGAATTEIERQMQDRARNTVSSADIVVLVHDCTDPRPPPALGVEVDLTVHTKLDLTGRAPPGLAVSAKTGARLDALRARLDALAFGEHVAAGATLALNARHVEAITNARHALRRALDVPGAAGPEVVALELRESLDALGTILGSVAPDDVIGRIFAAFCIGK